MLRIDADGTFWLPGQHDAPIAGRIKYDSVDGGSLSLIGSFGGMSGIANAAASSGERIRVHGAAGKRLLTLDDCLQTRVGFEAPGTPRQDFSIGRVLSGGLFDAGERLEFLSIAVTVDHLAHWVGRTGLSLTVTHTDEALQEVQIALKPLETETTGYQDGTLELRFTYSVSGDHVTRSLLTHGSALRYAPGVAVDLDEGLLPVAGALQDLVTIACDVPCLVDEITLTHPDVTTSLPGGETIHDPIRLWATNRAMTKPPRRYPRPDEMLFTLEQMGGVASVAGWLAVAERYRAALDSLMSLRYAGTQYVQTRMFNMAQAAETFHRVRFANHLRSPAEYKSFKRKLASYVPRKSWRSWLHEQLQYSNEPRLKHRLCELAEYAGDAFLELVPDPSVWAEEVKNARNGLVHHQGPGLKPPSPARLHFLSESVFYLVVLCLLRECGMSDDLLLGVAKNRRYQWLKAQLASID